MSTFKRDLIFKCFNENLSQRAALDKLNNLYGTDGNNYLYNNHFFISENNNFVLRKGIALFRSMISLHWKILTLLFRQLLILPRLPYSLIPNQLRLSLVNLSGIPIESFNGWGN